MTSPISDLVAELQRKAAQAPTTFHWQHALLVRAADALSSQARELAEARAENERLREENAGLRLTDAQICSQAAAALDRATAAERQRDEAMEALKPFVDACPDNIIPDLHPMSGTGLGDEWRPNLFVRDFRRARSVLENGKGMPAASNPQSACAGEEAGQGAGAVSPGRQTDPAPERELSLRRGAGAVARAEIWISPSGRRQLSFNEIDGRCGTLAVGKYDLYTSLVPSASQEGDDASDVR